MNFKKLMEELRQRPTRPSSMPVEITVQCDETQGDKGDEVSLWGREVRDGAGSIVGVEFYTKGPAKIVSVKAGRDGNR